MPKKSKVKIIFHMGLNKSGSSYLQQLFSHNFNDIGSKLLYPKPHRPSGNAGAVAEAIRDMDKDAAMAELGNLIGQSGPTVETVILSTEFMYHQFVKTEQRKLFHSVLSEYGVEDITLVLVFRNIYEHAVSAFCHRCGTKAMPPFESWIADNGSKETNSRDRETSYEFWRETRALLSIAKTEYFKIRFFPYSRKMEEDWSDFLGVKLEAPPHKNVNVTVSPSEAEALRHLYNIHGRPIDGLRARLKAIKRSEKADDSELLNHYHSLISAQLAKLEVMIKRAEEVLGFEISSHPATLKDDTGPVLKFNELQISTLLDHVEEKPRFSKGLVKQIVPRSLLPLARKLYRRFL